MIIEQGFIYLETVLLAFANNGMLVANCCVLLDSLPAADWLHQVGEPAI